MCVCVCVYFFVVHVEFKLMGSSPLQWTADGLVGPLDGGVQNKTVNVNGAKCRLLDKQFWSDPSSSSVIVLKFDFVLLSIEY